MGIKYWIYDGDWKEVSATEYYNFNGGKQITSNMGLGWKFTEKILLSYRYMKGR